MDTHEIRTFWSTQLERCPAIRPWLERAARVALRRERMPSSLTLGSIPEDHYVRQALDTLFGPCREERGRLKARLDDTLRRRQHWLPLASLLDIEAPSPPAASAAKRFVGAIQRLKLLHPDELDLIRCLSASYEGRHFRGVHTDTERELIALFDALKVLRSEPAGITLSELGARCFNDSKALRTGRLRQQLEHLLRLDRDALAAPERDILSEAGVIDNPITTQVAVFAPFAYCASDGVWQSWPYRLWLRGEAVLLTWQTVKNIQAIRIDTPVADQNIDKPATPQSSGSASTLVTSENAAPFQRLIEQRISALYTAGYPNAAVSTLLDRFAEAGATAIHWGDTDLDGYLIAEQVGRRMPVRLYRFSQEEELHARLRPLESGPRSRAERFLATHPDFPYRDELQRTLNEGWLEQEHGSLAAIRDMNPQSGASPGTIKSRLREA